MSESLTELLRRSADAVREPSIDVGELVAVAVRRQRHRRVAIAAGAAGLVGAIVVGSFVVRGGQPSDLEPAPSPTPNVVDPGPDGTRPLVYAEGSTVHVGDRSVHANARVMFVDGTDDGVVFMTDRDDRLWFDDGSTTEVIGVVHTPHVGSYDVFTGNPGSLVAWFARNPDWPRAELDVYDTSRHEVVAQVRDPDYFVLGVTERSIYTNPDWSDTPGCWVVDVRPCPDPRLFRYDVASGSTEQITRDAYEAELRAHPRGFAGTADDETSITVVDLGSLFTRVGHRLVPTDPKLTRTTGEPVELRWPGAGTGPDTAAGFWVTQWLDDDRLVLAGYQDLGDGAEGIGQGDSYAASFVDLLVCTLSNGVCEVVVERSNVPYLLPGPRGVFSLTGP